MKADNQNEDIFKEWLTARREETDGLDIRQAIRLELEDSPILKTPEQPDNCEPSLLAIPNILLSTLIRVGTAAGWFLFNT